MAVKKKKAKPKVKPKVKVTKKAVKKPVKKAPNKALKKAAKNYKSITQSKKSHTMGQENDELLAQMQSLKNEADKKSTSYLKGDFITVTTANDGNVVGRIGIVERESQTHVYDPTGWSYNKQYIRKSTPDEVRAYQSMILGGYEANTSVPNQVSWGCLTITRADIATFRKILNSASNVSVLGIRVNSSLLDQIERIMKR